MRFFPISGSLPSKRHALPHLHDRALLLGPLRQPALALGFLYMHKEELE